MIPDNLSRDDLNKIPDEIIPGDFRPAWSQMIQMLFGSFVTVITPFKTSLKKLKQSETTYKPSHSIQLQIQIKKQIQIQIQIQIQRQRQIQIQMQIQIQIQIQIQMQMQMQTQMQCRYRNNRQPVCKFRGTSARDNQSSNTTVRVLGWNHVLLCFFLKH